VVVVPQLGCTSKVIFQSLDAVVKFQSNPLASFIAIALLTVASSLYAGDISIDDSASLTVDGERTLPLRVVFKACADSKPVPVIVLSHGTFSSGKKYDPVSQYWAEHGYVVILPDHRDANYGELPKSEAHMLEIIGSRARDLVAIADQIDSIGEMIPGLKVCMDTSALVSAGHSVGTQIAMQMTGLKIRNPNTGEITGIDEDRYKATVLLSDPGKMAVMPDDIWLGGSAPTLLVTGPDDFGLMGKNTRQADYQNEMLEPASPMPGHRYLLTITGMDHQFGGLIHKDIDAEPDTEALELFLQISTAFLDVYAKDEKSADGMLEPRKISDRATLTVE
jgi:dienelactone hydrolase